MRAMERAMETALGNRAGTAVGVARLANERRFVYNFNLVLGPSLGCPPTNSHLVASEHRMRVLSRPNIHWRSPQIANRARHLVSSARCSANPYPYPPNSNPTPHQIFHLPLSASQKEVKARCAHPIERSPAVRN